MVLRKLSDAPDLRMVASVDGGARVVEDELVRVFVDDDGYRAPKAKWS